MEFDLNEELAEQAATKEIWLKRLAWILGVLIVLGAIGYGMKGLFAGGEPKKKSITKITLKDLPPPPPPPPPPPKEQPKELKEQPKEVKAEQPKPAETPPVEQLKMEGEAGDGSSPFAAGSVKDEYNGGDVKTIGSDGGAKFNWYAGLLKTQIENALSKNKRLTEDQYRFQVNVWLKSDGRIEKLEWVRTEADSEIESLIKDVLKDMPPMREMPPQDMPQPIKLRITARKMG